jgi:hypothetical protein
MSCSRSVMTSSYQAEVYIGARRYLYGSGVVGKDHPVR